MVAAAMIDQLVHCARVIALKSDSYRLKDRDLGRVPTQPVRASREINSHAGGQISTAARGSVFGCR